MTQEVLQKHLNDMTNSKDNEKQVPIDEEKVLIGVRKGVALSIMNYLDNNTVGMCLSNMECKDLEDAVVNSKWDKVYTHMKRKLEKQDEKNPIEEGYKVVPGLYKCIHRMFDGTPEGRLLFEVDEIYKCLTKHDKAEFEVSYGHSIYLEDPTVRKHFIPIEKLSKDDMPYWLNGDGIIEHRAAITALKKLYEQKPAEWSEEDKSYITELIGCFENEKQLNHKISEIVDWLKSLRPQNHWKPNMAQINALYAAIKQVDKGNADVLKGLYEKLMGLIQE